MLNASEEPIKKHLVCCALFALSGCAAPAAEPEAQPISFPALEDVLGAAPAEEDIADDVKTDELLPARFTELLAQQSAVRDPAKLSLLRSRLMQAGFYAREAPVIFLGVKAVTLAVATGVVVLLSLIHI